MEAFTGNGHNTVAFICVLMFTLTAVLFSMKDFGMTRSDFSMKWTGVGGNTSISAHVRRPPPPKLILVCRTTSSHADDLFTYLMPSLSLFWHPFPAIRFVLDEENPEDAKLAERLKALGPQVSVSFEAPNDAVYHGNGHDRQQWSNFYADVALEGSGYEYAGIVDTDSLFVAPIETDFLFEEGKPVVVGLSGKPKNWWWEKVPSRTLSILNKKSVMDCMNYFPVIYKLSHLRLMREYIANLHGKTFDAAFHDVAREGGEKFYSQFDIMCNYVWYFQNEDYAWHFQITDYTWFGVIPGQVKDFEWIPWVMQQPYVRYAIHWNYDYFSNEYSGVKRKTTDVLREAVCQAFNGTAYLEDVGEMCRYDAPSWKSLDAYGRLVNKDLFCFEHSCFNGHARNWVEADVPALIKAQDNYYARVHDTGKPGGTGLITLVLAAAKTAFTPAPPAPPPFPPPLESKAP